MDSLFYIIIVLLTFILLLSVFFSKKRRGRKHARYRKRARRAHERINGELMPPGQAMSYLRKVSPYVFEEMVLDGFEAAGFRAIRNRRYSGDGGIDGRVVKDGEEFLVQCKRYKGHINAAHVEEFACICRESGKRGFFVHTGRTGRKSKMNAQYGNVRVVSGSRLLELLKGTYTLN